MTSGKATNTPVTGPFEVSSTNQVPLGSAPTTTSSETELVRELDCKNYTTCLNLAAALNWESFTCEGCSGEINKSLSWRAGQSAIKDKVVKLLCGKAVIKILNYHDRSKTNSKP
jgi:hypothetical protein